MAEEKPESKLTEYVILLRLENQSGEVYGVVARSEGRGARSAVSAYLDGSAEEDSVYLAVPTSSFNLFSARKEQPPPVFRLTEISNPTPTPLGAEPGATGSPSGGEVLTKTESAPEDTPPQQTALA